MILFVFHCPVGGGAGVGGVPQMAVPKYFAASAALLLNGTWWPCASFIPGGIGTKGRRRFLKPVNISLSSTSSETIFAVCFLLSFLSDFVTAFLCGCISGSVRPSCSCFFRVAIRSWVSYETSKGLANISFSGIYSVPLVFIHEVMSSRLTALGLLFVKSLL